MPITTNNNPSSSSSTTTKRGLSSSPSPSPLSPPTPPTTPSSPFLLPAHIYIHTILPYLNGAALGQWEQVCQSTREMVHENPSLWEAVHAQEFGWIMPAAGGRETKQQQRLPSFLPTAKQLYLKLREASWPTVRTTGLPFPTAVIARRPGKIYVIGGSTDRPVPLDDVEAFHDIGKTRVKPGGWACPFETNEMPPLRIKRAAPGVARDVDDGLWVLGGWSEDGALVAVEKLGVEQKQQAPSRDNEGSEEDEDGDGDGSNDQPQEHTDGGEWRRKDAWEVQPSLHTARCFLAGATDLQGRLYAIGGGDSIWQGSHVFTSTEILDDPSSFSTSIAAAAAASSGWRPGPSMTDARCGLAATLHANGHIYAAGGYGGGTKYLSSVEVLLSGDAEGSARGWMPKQVPSMLVPRTGFGLACGPDQCLYAVGGSPDGLHSHRSTERIDLREGRWTLLPKMLAPHGYCSATFAASGLLYAVGGQAGEANEGALTRLVEVWDPRAYKWRALPRSAERGIERVDLAVVYALL